MKKKHPVIKISSEPLQCVVVDEEAFIKDGMTCLLTNGDGTYLTGTIKDSGKQFNRASFNEFSGCYKLTDLDLIIGSIGPEIMNGIPQIIPDPNYKAAVNIAAKEMGKEAEWIMYPQEWRDGYVEGYKARASNGTYTEADLRKAIDLAKSYKQPAISGNFSSSGLYEPDEIISIISKPPLPKYVELEYYEGLVYCTNHECYLPGACRQPDNCLRAQEPDTLKITSTIDGKETISSPDVNFIYE